MLLNIVIKFGTLVELGNTQLSEVGLHVFIPFPKFLRPFEFYVTITINGTKKFKPPQQLVPPTP